ncbi:NADH-quinone oxidoreductase subunit L [Buchnera aphidicola]|uniref:NADH-quinone oxidoreductase subunit L n=1 Tax=Buchnera aphidicola TaxID=9 RepID=UPI0031B89CB2
MNILYLIFFFPFFSSLFLFFFKEQIGVKLIYIFGIGSIFFSTCIVFFLKYLFFSHIYYIFSEKLWTWLKIKNFSIDICFLLDNLSHIFLLMISCISLLICIFSIWYMKKRYDSVVFFSLVNFFVANMFFLVLSDNFISMYAGWEGVSFCSYALINFYYLKSYVNNAAFRVFVITKIGDLFLITAILLLYKNFNTVNFYEIQFLIKIHLIKYNYFLNFINLFLFFGALGKSAQVPLQIWLSEAMVGPTPVSALIHAATMVTAGIYLILRNHDLFCLTPHILYLCGVVGSITMLLSSLSAVFQFDIKRILAYSTMSQLGYIFLALSVKAWNASLLHLLSHAVFKALLFLSSGVLIKNCNNQKNIFYMGNMLYKEMPFIYVCFLISGSALSAFPILTSGFYSKGAILLALYEQNNIFLFIISIVSAFLTTIYIFRLIFIVFHTKSDIFLKNFSISFVQYFPLSILAILSTYLNTYLISKFLLFSSCVTVIYNHDKFYIEFFSSIFTILGIYFTYYLYYINTNFIRKTFLKKCFHVLKNIFLNHFYFLKLYNLLFLEFYLMIVKIFSYSYFSFIPKYLILIFEKFYSYLLYFEDCIISVYIIFLTIIILFFCIVIH